MKQALTLVLILALVLQGCGPCSAIKTAHDGVVVGLVYPYLDGRASADPEFAMLWHPLRVATESCYATAMAGCEAGRVDRATIAKAAGCIADVIELYGSFQSTTRAREEPEWVKQAVKMRRLQAEALNEDR